ncbi:MAG: nucleoside hydrolase [Acidimicrobiales bacterium]
MARPIIVDTDGGVDDAAALWWALQDPALEVLAVTVVWGNVPLATAVSSVGRVLCAAGRPDIPVAVGASGPVGAAPELRPATFIHGDDGLGNTTDGLPMPVFALSGVPAPVLLRNLCAERPGEVSLLTIGPLSNLGLALAENPGFAATVRELVVMGGSARAGGNALPNGEANIAHDPVAAARVAAAGWAVPPLLVGLDVTRAATLTEAHFGLLAEHRSAAAAFLDAPLRFYRRFGGAMTAPDCPCHDLVATMALSDPTLIPDAPVLPMAVDAAGGPAWGSTVVDFRAAAMVAQRGAEQDRPEGFGPWRIGLRADVGRFREQAAALFGG